MESEAPIQGHPAYSPAQNCRIPINECFPDHATAILFSGDGAITTGHVALNDPTAADVVVEVEYSGISTGTERLLWSGEMPPFPGLSYPLVPGYESVGRIVWAGRDSSLSIGTRVFVPGSHGFKDVQGVFGGAAKYLVAPTDRAVPFLTDNPREGVLLALAATALHAIEVGGAPELIVGHGVLGRLLARISLAKYGVRPTVWEKNTSRQNAESYNVIDPEADERRDYNVICDVSGDSGLLDRLVSHLGRQGIVCLAGFYSNPLHFTFPSAFQKEAQFRIAAEWRPEDLKAVIGLIEQGKLSLDGLITHLASPVDADNAYRTAFTDPACLKMVLDWRGTNG